MRAFGENEVAYYGRFDQSGELVGLFRGIIEGDAVVKGEMLRPEGWVVYPDLIRYLYVTGEVTAADSGSEFAHRQL
jgi:hypothetical protein